MQDPTDTDPPTPPDGTGGASDGGTTPDSHGHQGDEAVPVAGAVATPDAHGHQGDEIVPVPSGGVAAPSSHGHQGDEMIHRPKG
jgi:hypothetical protein